MLFMKTKWKIILLVMLIIISICGVFITLFVFDSRENLKRFVDSETRSIRAIVEATEEENSRYYRNRIRAFVSYEEVPKQEKLINAFAQHNREELLRMSTPYLNFLIRENPHFSTFSWVTPDNKVFLRVHNPDAHGGVINKMRPDVVDANRESQPYSGYMIAKTGLQYRLVQPVSYAGQHVGIVQFGLKDDLLLDKLRTKLNLPVGIAITNKRFSVIERSKLPTLSGNTHTIQSKQIDLFQEDHQRINWNLVQQKVTLQKKTYIIVNAFNLLNYKQEPQGYIFVALDISGMVQTLQSRILFVLLLSSVLLLLSFFILNSSYGKLVQKIIDLNLSLEKSNLDLEERVQERTVKLKNSEERLQKILNQAPLGILIANSETMQLQYVNPNICTMLGYDREEMKSISLESLHSPEDSKQITKNFKAQAQGIKDLATDIPFLRKDGSLFEADVISAPIELEGNACVVAFIMDRTESKKLALQLHRAQKMEAIGMMAGGVAHDLNNILSGIVSYPEILLLQLPASSELRESILAIQESGKRAATVVADLLTVARGAASIREPHDINLLLDEYSKSPECIKNLTAHPEIVCVKAFTAENSFISCSPMHIKKTVMNLLINAVEAIGDKGTVVISTVNKKIEKSTDLTGETLAAGSYVVLTVEDDGPGIASKDIEHIFEPFYTRKVMGKSGTGLGLAVVWNSVQDHNGSIFVESSAKGTSFQLYFPVTDEQETIKTSSETTLSFPGNHEHILVVDDEPQLRDIASQMLCTLNYSVDSVSSGELALQFIKKTPVDLVIIDMLMDPGMNGCKTYEEMLKLYPDQKAIVASGFSESADVKATIQLGASGFIKKPYSMDQLARIVKEALSS